MDQPTDECTIAATPANTFHDPFSYTGGGWLYRDQESRNSRRLNFDFGALQRQAIKATPGAKKVTAYRKIDGSSNRIFFFKTDNDVQVVAKIPFKLGNPMDMTVHSEVAGIRYVQSKTNIPTPKILDYSGDTSNPVGIEYLIYEPARGVQLSEIWPSMTTEQKVKCIQALHIKLKELAGLEFPGFGHLYEVAYATQAGLDQIPLDDQFCIGPRCDGMFWVTSQGCDKFNHDVQPNRGPWKDLRSYCHGIIDTSISNVPLESSYLFQSEARPSWHGSPTACTAALETLRAAMDAVTQDDNGVLSAEISQPLMMPYIPKRHIFVSESDPTQITDIIDFQHTGPDAPFNHASLILTFIEPSQPHQAEDDILMQTWMRSALEHIPRLMGSVLAGPLSQFLFSPIATCDHAWISGVPLLQQSLQELRECWSHLGFSSPCPIPPLSEEATRELSAAHDKAKAAMHMRMTLTSKMKCRYDLWVPIHEWPFAMLSLLLVWTSFVEALGPMEITEGVTMSAEDVRLMWPFDIPVQMGEDLVLISPRSMSTAVSGVFGEEQESSGGGPTGPGKADKKEEKKKKKEKEKEERKGEAKGGLLKGWKKRFS